MSVSFYEPFYDLERFADTLFQSECQRHGQQPKYTRGSEGGVRPFKPRMDLHEDTEKNLVTATFDFPGVSKENIHIELQNGRLTVSAETRQSEEHTENGYAVRERRCGKYLRTLQVPPGVKDEELKASMENGVLTITFPKSTPELPKRIAIA